ncbi:FAD-dependent oxidoreductase [Chloroflexota bacterium]
MEKLFEPTNIGKVKVKNRIVFPAAHTCLGNPDGTVSQRMIDSYVRRAAGGVGMIVVEFCTVDPVQRASLTQIKIADDRFIDGLSRLASSIKSFGVTAALQLHHPGRISDTRISGVQAVAPSAVPSEIIREVPRELTDQEVWGLVNEFVEGIRRTKEAGFDAVELHGATGYLIHQFFSPVTNRRQDSWGGDTERRCRFVREIVKRGKEKVGREFPIILRLAAEDFVDGGLGIEESKKIAQIMEKDGIDCMSITAGVYYSPVPYASPSKSMKPGCYADLAAAIKQVFKGPVMVAGRINSPQVAERILQQNKADLVCICRALIADPDLPNKAREHKYSEIRRCVMCSVCSDSMTRQIPGGAVVCLVNPEHGHEGAPEVKVQADQPRRVMVLGGSPAGLEAARVASMRGHVVALLDENPQLGGRWSWTLESYIKNRLLTLRKLGVDVRLGTPFSRATVEKWAPDVVIATRRLKAAIPNIPGIGSVKCCTTDDVFSGKCTANGKIAVLGGNNIGLEVAELLSGQGNNVTVVEEGWLGRGLARRNRPEIIDKESKQGVRFLAQSKVIEVTGSSLVFVDQEQKKYSLDLDWLVFALPAVIDDEPANWRTGQSFKVVWINPAQSPRSYVDAFEEGISLGRMI